MAINVDIYQEDIKNAIIHFWTTRNKQINDQKGRQIRDQGNRGAVTGGKQLDGFINLLKKISIDVGIPEEFIFTKGNHLPGFFRPTKEWDFLVISPGKKLIACIELKSQVGSFGNNFNNRTEEALGSAVDLWTAYREQVFPKQQPPWLGYLTVVEKSEKSLSPVRINEPHLKTLEEFHGTSYLDRYRILCQKLMAERHYSATGLIWTSSNMTFGSLSDEVSIEAFLRSYMGFLYGNLAEFKLK